MTICPTDNDILLCGHGDLDHAKFACDTFNSVSENPDRAYVAIDWDSAWSDENEVANLDYYDSRKTNVQRPRRDESSFPIAGSSEDDDDEFDDEDEDEDDEEFEDEESDYDDTGYDEDEDEESELIDDDDDNDDTDFDDVRDALEYTG